MVLTHITILMAIGIWRLAPSVLIEELDPGTHNCKVTKEWVSIVRTRILPGAQLGHPRFISQLAFPSDLLCSGLPTSSL